MSSVQPLAGPLVGVIMGSKSDWETMRHAVETLEAFGYRTRRASYPRTAPPTC